MSHLWVYRLSILMHGDYLRPVLWFMYCFVFLLRSFVLWLQGCCIVFFF